MIQEVTEVDVEQLNEEEEEELGGGFGLSRFRNILLTDLSILLHHDVGVVSVSDPQDEGSNAVTSTRPGEQVDGPVIPEGDRWSARPDSRSQSDIRQIKQ